ncbi:MAG: adenylate/guanylate cyclase domain-containing protein [Gallionella sp.]|nr:adenylate/guanylate cyclase domain-containing protein [Gallionella sp.]
MEDRGNKTIMCSVFFLDIVEYSKKSVAGQISLKDRFNSYLSEAIRDVPVADRIILDTGDGAAINFLGDVEDALKAALSLRESLLEKEDPGSDNPLLVRMGVNLGPVRLVRDINGQPNIVGDGINVAQRVMGFADAGQVLVSRSYFDAVSRLSSQYAEMFHYQGSRTDKHVREHEVYAIGYPGELAPKGATAVGAGPAVESVSPLVRIGAAWDAAASRLDAVAAPLIARVVQLEPKLRIIYAGIGVGLLLVVGLAVTLSGSDEAGDAREAAVQPVSAVMAAVSEEQAKKDVSARAEPAPLQKKDASQSLADKKTAEKKAAEKKLSNSKTENKKTAAPAATSMGGLFDTVDRGPDGFLSVSCKDGAQVFVDGSQKGKTGATAQLTLAVVPGKHTVIVSHPSGGISTQTVDIQSGKTVRIMPGFCGQ